MATTLQHHSVQASPQNNNSTITTPTPSIPVTTTPSTPRNVYTTTTYASSTKSDSPPQFIWNDHHVRDDDPVSPRMLSAMEPTNHVLTLTPSPQLEGKRSPLASATNRVNNTDGNDNYNNRSITTAKIKNRKKQFTSWQEPTKKASNSIVKGRSGKGNKKQMLHNSLPSSSLSPPAHAPSYHRLSVTQRHRCSQRSGSAGTTEGGSNRHRHKANKQQSSDSSWFDDMPFISFNEV